MRLTYIAILLTCIIILASAFLFLFRRKGGGLENGSAFLEKPVKLTLESKSSMICRMVGTNSSLEVGIWGADLGVPVVTTINGNSVVAFLFGDVFSPSGGGANAIAYADQPLNGCPNLKWVTRAGKFAEMWSSRRLDGVDASTVPAGAVEINGVLYVYAMRVTHWKKKLLQNDTTHAYGVLFKRTADGEFAETDVKWDLDYKFVNVAPVVGELPSGEKVVYLLASGKYRDSPVYLAYVPIEFLEDKSRYMYYTGEVDGEPRWSSNIEDAVPVISGVRVGELSVVYHEGLKLYLIMFKDYSMSGGLKLIAARNPWGPYSEPLILNPCYPKPEWFEKSWGGCYGGYIVPGSYGSDGKDLYYVLSLWRPYATFLMKIKISAN